MRFGENDSWASAAPALLPRIDWARRLSLRGLTRIDREKARASVSPTRRGVAFLLMDAYPFDPGEAEAFLSPEWPWNVRVGANSPNLWPTMFSVTITGTCLWPLWTPNVRPTNCGRMVERRDQILI